MPKIQLLNEQTIDQIAAGEVVERPASVVKELVENAIDAGARVIRVEIRDGGTTLIRVTDNGCGIDSEEIPLAFLPHSTSKIRSLDDLSTISSLGFRGEALASIASVARVEMISKTKETLTGYRFCIEGGKEVAAEEVGAPNGTTLLVKDLFFNTPARKKFLKTPQTEGAQIGDLMEHIALSHPEISFQFENNGQIRLHTSGNGKLLDVIYAVYGRETAAAVWEVCGDFGGFSVSGYIGSPTLSRGNRNFENFFINGRYIKSTLLAKAVEDAYHGFLMQHRYPFCVLLLRMDGELVDVNVHPNKMELRFVNERELYERLAGSLRDTLSGREMITDASDADEDASRARQRPVYDKRAIPEPFEETRRAREREDPARPAAPSGDAGGEEKQARAEAGLYGAEESANEAAFAVKEPVRYDPAGADADGEAEQMDLFSASGDTPPLLSREGRSAHRVIGQLFDTYWLVEYADCLYMIDQHAAHEKVLFEETMRRYRGKEFTAQMVSPPILLQVSLKEEELLERHLADFERLGFSIEPFGNRTYAIRAVPDNLYGLDGEELLRDLVDELSGAAERETPERIAEKIARMSCRAAVKGNQHLSRAEVEHLLDDLLSLENPYFCPHGRPVIVSMTRAEIEKKFKRIV